MVYTFSVIYFDYTSCVQSFSYVQYDVETITAGDYTVEMNVSKDQYDYWLKYYHQKNNPISECAQFKVYIQSILEERVAEIKELGYG